MVDVFFPVFYIDAFWVWNCSFFPVKHIDFLVLVVFFCILYSGGGKNANIGNVTDALSCKQNGDVMFANWKAFHRDASRGTFEQNAFYDNPCYFFTRTSWSVRQLTFCLHGHFVPSEHCRLALVRGSRFCSNLTWFSNDKIEAFIGLIIPVVFEIVGKIASLLQGAFVVSGVGDIQFNFYVTYALNVIGMI